MSCQTAFATYRQIGFTILTALLASLLAQSLPAQELSPSIVDTRPAQGRFVQWKGKYLVEHTFNIPGTDVRFQLIPVRPINEDREPFWLGKHEVTFREYREFCRLDEYLASRPKQRLTTIDPLTATDAVTAPTAIYDSSRFDSATSLDCPAYSMTLYAARQYTKWLSLISDESFRLPTESEWMFAAADHPPTSSAGPTQPNEVANYGGRRNSTMPVGSFQPNAQGFFDMRGNVSEWVITKLSPRFTTIDTEDVSLDFGEKDLSRWIAKGGNFSSPPKECAVNFRRPATVDLWDLDPSLPNSPHWLCRLDEQSLIGFRLVRQLGKANHKSMRRFWDPVSEGYTRRVAVSIAGGITRAVAVDESLNEEMQQSKVNYPQWNIADE